MPVRPLVLLLVGSVIHYNEIHTGFRERLSSARITWEPGLSCPSTWIVFTHYPIPHSAIEFFLLRPLPTITQKNSIFCAPLCYFGFITEKFHLLLSLALALPSTDDFSAACVLFPMLTPQDPTSGRSFNEVTPLCQSDKEDGRTSQT